MLTDVFLHGKFMHLGTHTPLVKCVRCLYHQSNFVLFDIFIAECNAEVFEGLFTLETIPRSLPCTSGLCLLGGVTVATKHLGQYDNHVHLIQKQSNLRKFPMTLSQLADFVVVVVVLSQ